MDYNSYKTMTAADFAVNPQFMPLTPRGMPEGKMSIGKVEATACQAKLTDPVPDYADAYLMLKREAANRGAIGLANAGMRTISTATAHCYTSVYAYGEGYTN